MDHSFCYLMLVPIQVPQGVTDDTHMFLYIILSHGIWKVTFFGLKHITYFVVKPIFIIGNCDSFSFFIDQTTGSHHDLKWVNETGSLHFIRCFGCKYCENNEFQNFFQSPTQSAVAQNNLSQKSQRENLLY